jgi:4-hydroxy-3-methylbut-2-enyl diphosphate reductase
MKNNRIKIIVGEPIGFCSGVKRAIALVKQETLKATNGKPVYSLGPIIHNSGVIKDLKKLGVKTIIQIDKLKKITGKSNNKPVVIIRSHGCAPKVISDIRKLGYRVVDATCPYVKRVQNYAKKLKYDGYTTIVVGDKHHPEVQGILGYAMPMAKVYDLSSKFKVQSSKFKSNRTRLAKAYGEARVGIVGQTTISAEEFEKAISSLNHSKIKDVKVFNTLCKESLNRQKTCKEIAKQVDLMIVIGSRQSANTLTLVDIAKSINHNVCQVENKKGLKNLNPASARSSGTRLEVRNLKFKKIGVIAGASTPQNTVLEVVQQIKKITTKGEIH